VSWEETFEFLGLILLRVAEWQPFWISIAYYIFLLTFASSHLHIA